MNVVVSRRDHFIFITVTTVKQTRQIYDCFPDKITDWENFAAQFNFGDPTRVGFIEYYITGIDCLLMMTGMASPSMVAIDHTDFELKELMELMGFAYPATGFELIH